MKCGSKLSHECNVTATRMRSCGGRRSCELLREHAIQPGYTRSSVRYIEEIWFRTEVRSFLDEYIAWPLDGLGRRAETMA